MFRMNRSSDVRSSNRRRHTTSSQCAAKNYMHVANTKGYAIEMLARALVGRVGSRLDAPLGLYLKNRDECSTSSDRHRDAGHGDQE